MKEMRFWRFTKEYLEDEDMFKQQVKAPLRSSLAATVAAAILVASTPAPAGTWYCSARGTTGASGWGWSASLPYAKLIALRECAVRTPQDARCYIMYCS
jgi:hypothetical protein